MKLIGRLLKPKGNRVIIGIYLAVLVIYLLFYCCIWYIPNWNDSMNCSIFNVLYLVISCTLLIFLFSIKNKIKKILLGVILLPITLIPLIFGFVLFTDKMMSTRWFLFRFGDAKTMYCGDRKIPCEKEEDCYWQAACDYCNSLDYNEIWNSDLEEGSNIIRLPIVRPACITETHCNKEGFCEYYLCNYIFP